MLARPVSHVSEVAMARSYHCAFAAGPNLHIFDVWDSQEAFEKFGETLMPILGDLGVDPGEPVVAEIHNVVVG
jgi:hypothetical protein